MSNYTEAARPPTWRPKRATISAAKAWPRGRLGLLASVVLGISTIAPVYTLTGALGPTVREVGTPAVFIVGFLPMLLVALGYRELNSAEPDSGTSFTWSARAFGPMIGWIGGGGWWLPPPSCCPTWRGGGRLLLPVPRPDHRQARAGGTGRQPVDQHRHLLCVHRPGGLDLLPGHGHHHDRAVWPGGLQLLVVGFAFAAFGGTTAPPPMAFDLAWFNPFGVESFSAFAAGLSLSIFIFWGWDTCLTVSERVGWQ